LLWELDLIRYDLSFFVIRFDLDLKPNPAMNLRKWFKEYNFANSVLNLE
jgi:hypothetical protein